MAKAVKILSLIAKILLIISLVVHIPGCLTICGIAGLIVTIIALKKLSSGGSIALGVFALLLIWGNPVGILLIVIAILSKKVNAAAEYAEEAEELVEE